MLGAPCVARTCLCSARCGFATLPSHTVRSLLNSSQSPERSKGEHGGLSVGWLLWGSVCVLLGQVPRHHGHSVKRMTSPGGEVLPINFNKAFLISSSWVRLTCEELMVLLLLSLDVNARAAGCGAPFPWFARRLLVE